MRALKVKIKEYLDQRQNVLWEEHERVKAAEFLNNLMQSEIQKITPKKTILTKIEQYKRVLKLAKVPKIIIENPGFINSMPITSDDIEWAKKQIHEHEQYLKFQKKSHHDHDMFTDKEIKSAKAVRDNIIKNSNEELMSIYMAGEICMWDEMRSKQIRRHKPGGELEVKTK